MSALHACTLPQTKHEAASGRHICTLTASHWGVLSFVTILKILLLHVCSSQRIDSKKWMYQNVSLALLQLRTHPSADCSGSRLMLRPVRVFTPMVGVDWKEAAPYRDKHRDRISTRPAPLRQPAISAVPGTLRSGPSCRHTTPCHTCHVWCNSCARSAASQ